MSDVPNQGRLRGLDVGGKRIGVAVSDEGQILASAWGMVEQGRNAIVAGLPTGRSGREGAQAADTRRFADSVGEALDLPLSYWDERLTSSQAERMLVDAGMRRKERRNQIDALAASLMLQTYLDSRMHRRRRSEASRKSAAS